MTEDRILELIRQHRDHQRRRYQAMERRGQFIIALIAALGAAMVALTGGNMSEVWGSMLPLPPLSPTNLTNVCNCCQFWDSMQPLGLTNLEKNCATVIRILMREPKTEHKHK